MQKNTTYTNKSKHDATRIITQADLLSVTVAKNPEKAEFILATPRHLPRRHAEFLAQQDFGLLTTLRTVARAIREGELGVSAPLLGPNVADEQTADQRTYDSYFGVQRTSGNAVAALAEAAWLSSHRLTLIADDENRALAQTVQNTIADLLEHLAEMNA